MPDTRTEIPLSGHTTPDPMVPEVHASRLRRWWVLVVALVVVVATVGWMAWPADEADADAAATAPVNTAQVQMTDLSSVTTYSATLGRIAGDGITSGLAGTVTAMVAPGEVVDEGEVLFAVDDAPVSLLIGDAPMYRTLALSEEAVAITGRSAGTLTDAAAVGEVLRQGDVVYRIDAVPVVLLYGDQAMWRTLSTSSDDGPDIEQLEAALVELGYDPDGTVTVDEEFTSYTRSMVKRWQEDLGLEETGSVDVGDVIVAPGPVEVRAHTVAVGQSAGEGAAVMEIGSGVPPSGQDVEQLEAALTRLGYSDGGDLVVDGVFDTSTRRAVVAWQQAIGATADGVLERWEVVFASAPVRIAEHLVSAGTVVGEGVAVLGVTGSDIVVALDLPAADQDLVSVGDLVTVELPDGTDVEATVDSVDEIATIGDDGTAVFEVTILLTDPDAASGLDEAPVDVDIVTDSVEGVMAVPVAALIALAEGGYAVEVAGTEPARLVGVTPGFFANGMVEVTSDDLSIDDMVVVP